MPPFMALVMPSNDFKYIVVILANVFAFLPRIRGTLQGRERCARK